jgi:hypothetical protein
LYVRGAPFSVGAPLIASDTNCRMSCGVKFAGSKLCRELSAGVGSEISARGETGEEAVMAPIAGLGTLSICSWGKGPGNDNTADKGEVSVDADADESRTVSGVKGREWVTVADDSTSPSYVGESTPSSSDVMACAR